MKDRELSIAKLTAYRIQLAALLKPERRFINEGVQQLQLIENATIQDLQSSEETTRTKLMDFRDKIYQESHKYPSRPLLCALFLQRKLSEIPIAFMSEPPNNPYAFSLFYDYLTGISSTTGVIEIAEKAIGETSEQATKTIANHLDFADKVAEALTTEGLALDRQINMFLGARRMRERFAKLLEQDPSGFILVDHIVDMLRPSLASNPSKSTSSCVPEFVAAGARLAQKTYKLIYPLTEIIS
ncbi:MAG: hypothetical protein HYY87_04220 [Candidatus Levybacteria bacterium]|nr:hypothetical protein [Candidatus Levybacteria bacterium]MBI2190152.1 hypothetical protein [Candidatus Levybacteria bacterium]MBI3070477.1 hypothetical protein [Candidatus Levybacteria bacterium]MBI3092766.1 hypothetical protein [Candidatus Levybacteria bacterium]